MGEQSPRVTDASVYPAGKPEQPLSRNYEESQLLPLQQELIKFPFICRDCEDQMCYNSEQLSFKPQSAFVNREINDFCFFIT